MEAIAEKKEIERLTKAFYQRNKDDIIEVDEEEIVQNLSFAPMNEVPTSEEIEQALIDKRKEDLLRKYANNDLLATLNDPEKQIADTMDTESNNKISD